MSEHASLTDHGEAHVHPPYIKIFLVLLVLTLLEYFYALIANRLGMTFVGLILGLMILAVTKAVLVGLYFMHLKFEGRWVYYMLVPAGILALIFVFALYPDIGTRPSALEGPDDDFVAAPARSAQLALALADRGEAGLR